MSGTSAPMTNAMNELPAAAAGDPMERASRPTSSKISNVAACSGSAKTRSTKCDASSAVNPRPWYTRLRIARSWSGVSRICLRSNASW